MGRTNQVGVLLAVVPVVAIMAPGELRRLLISDLRQILRPAPLPERGVYQVSVRGPYYGERELTRRALTSGRILEWDRAIESGVKSGEPWAMAQELLRDAQFVRGARPGLWLGTPARPGDPEDAVVYCERARVYARSDLGNAFFPLAEAYGHGVAGRLREAAAATHRAAGCARYRTYSEEWDRFTARHRDALEDRVILAWRAESLFHPVPEAARIVGDYAEAEEHAGRAVSSLAVRRDLFRIADMVERGRGIAGGEGSESAFRGAACGTERARRIWRAHRRVFGSPDEAAARRLHEREMYESLARYADAHGAADVADRATAIATSASQAPATSVAEVPLSDGMARIAVLRFAGLVLLGATIVFSALLAGAALACKRPGPGVHAWRAPALVACFVPELIAALGLLLRPPREALAGYPVSLVAGEVVWPQWYAPAALACALACGWAAWLTAGELTRGTRWMLALAGALAIVAAPLWLLGAGASLLCITVAFFVAMSALLWALSRPGDGRAWFATLAVSAAAGLLFLPVNWLGQLTRHGPVHVATDAVAGAFYLCVCLTVAVSGLWWLTNRLRGATTGAWVRGLFAVGLGYNLGIFATLLWILGRPADLVWLAPGLLPASCFMCVVLLFWLATRSRAENGARSLVSVRTAAASGLVVSLWLYALVGFASLPLRMAEHSRPDAQAQHRPLHD